MPGRSNKNYTILVLVLILLACDIFLLRLDFKSSEPRLSFAMLDIGQGDALFIESPTGTQVLIDGGPPRKILGQIARVMPPFDKKIDAIIITNPDQDHIGGFLDILKIYKVDKVFEPGTLNDSKINQTLSYEIKNKNIEEYLAKSGMRLDLGGGAVIDILFPDRDVWDWDTNEGSIVAKLTYGKHSIMLTGDGTAKTERIVLDNFGEGSVDSTVLKVGHHGSRTSTLPDFVKAVSPEYALISSGRENRYGHPHQDTLDTLSSFGAKIFQTDQDGTIIMKSDGENLAFSFHK